MVMQSSGNNCLLRSYYVLGTVLNARVLEQDSQQSFPPNLNTSSDRKLTMYTTLIWDSSVHLKYLPKLCIQLPCIDPNSIP